MHRPVGFVWMLGTFVWMLGTASAQLVSEQSVGLVTRFPLVGHGVGNLEHEAIPLTIPAAVREGVRLFDTAAASRNEKIVARSLLDADAPEDEVVVVTKVWYTHLGFERTMLSVRESLANLAPYSVAVLIHWPYCREDIAWMRCAEEEEELEATVRAAGPAPDRESWRASWRALEQLYATEPRLVAIGVSNFEHRELTQLLETATTPPHLAQINAWSVVFDPAMLQLLQKSGTHAQVYAALDGVTATRTKPEQLKRRLAALALLRRAGGGELSEAQVVLAWFARQGVSVIPRASRLEHVAENAAVADAQPLKDAAAARTATEQLMRCGADMPPGSAAALREAAAEGRTADVVALLRGGARPVETVDENGWDALHEAVRAGVRLELVRALVEHGADLAARTAAGQTPLSLAKQFLKPTHQTTLFLLESGAPDAADQEL